MCLFFPSGDFSENLDTKPSFVFFEVGGCEVCEIVSTASEDCCDSKYEIMPRFFRLDVVSRMYPSASNFRVSIQRYFEGGVSFTYKPYIHLV